MCKYTTIRPFTGGPKSGKQSVYRDKVIDCGCGSPRILDGEGPTEVVEN